MYKLAIAILVLFVFVTELSDANVRKVITFPRGTRLEQCVRNHIPNIFLNPIYEADALKVVNLKCNDPSITSFEGIEQFPNPKEKLFVCIIAFRLERRPK